MDAETLAAMSDAELINGALDYVAPVEICNRCLVIVDARASIRAVQNGFPNEYFTDFFNTKSLIQWARAMTIRGADIEMYAQRHTFEAISTWHGDPVCIPHLWELREAEQRRH
jgi:hypothetical protein